MIRLCLVLLLLTTAAYAQTISVDDTNGTPTGPAAGSLSGTYPNPGIASGATHASPAFTGTVTGNNTVPLAILTQGATNTLVGNATSGTANFTAISVGTCSTSSSAVIWTTNTGPGCNTAINAATLGSATFAAPGAIGSGTPSSAAFTTLSASSTVSGVGFSNLFASPGAIGGSSAAAGTFTTLAGTTSVTTPSVTSSSGDITVGSSSGNVRLGTGSAPTIASGACGAGSNGTMAAGSRSNAGVVQIAGVATTTCTIVFAAAMATAPVCVISASDSTAIGALVLPYISANTTAGFVITGSALASANFNYICL